MDRKTCYMAPVFDQDKLRRGTKVSYIIRNRKGVIMLQGTGEVSSNYGTRMHISPTDEDSHTILYNTIFITSEDVYHGKSSLKIISDVEEDK